MKFLVDMPLPPSLARWLAAKGHDALHALQLGLERASDAAILEHARREQCLVVTADLDYPRLLALTQAEGPGLILFRGGDYSETELLEHMAKVLATIPVAELFNSIIVVEKKRIRRRRLPLETNQ